MWQKEEGYILKKTDTIKERAIYVYLPSERRVKEWKTRAKKQSASISKFVIERLEDELRKYRAEVFLEERFEGVRRYDREQIGLLKRRGVVDSDELLQDLSIDPRESELVQAVSRHMDNLASYGLVAATKRGWRWEG